MSVDVFEYEPDLVDVDAEVRDLAGHLTGDEGAVTPTEVAEIERAARVPDDGRWRITDDDSAEWAMIQLGEAQRTLKELEEQRREYLARTERWFERASARARRSQAFMAGHLERYALEMRERSPRDKNGQPTRKTLVLPSGEVATTGGQPRAVITDEASVLEWAKASCPAMVRVREDVQVTTMRQWVTVEDREKLRVRVPDPETGEIMEDRLGEIPGVAVEEPQVTAKAKPFV